MSRASTTFRASFIDDDDDSDLEVDYLSRNRRSSASTIARSSITTKIIDKNSVQSPQINKDSQEKSSERRTSNYSKNEPLDSELDNQIDNFGEADPKSSSAINKLSSKIQSIDIDTLQHTKQWLLRPLTIQNEPTLCYIEREKSGFGLVQQIYRCYLEQNIKLSGSSNNLESDAKRSFSQSNSQGRFLMSAKKRSLTSTSYYLVSMEYDPSDRGSENVLGKVRGNSVGSQYTVYDHGLAPDKAVAPSLLRKELALINFSFDSGGPSQIQTYIPSVSNRGVWTIIQPTNISDSLSSRVAEKKLNDLSLLVNKKPRWDDNHGGHVLNFQGRVKEASVKNFQLCLNGTDEVLLQFGKVGKNKFSMDVRYPLSLYQAFSICVCAMDNKVADRKGYEIIRSIATTEPDEPIDKSEAQVYGSMSGSTTLSGRLRESLPSSQYLRDKLTRTFK